VVLGAVREATGRVLQAEPAGLPGHLVAADLAAAADPGLVQDMEVDLEVVAGVADLAVPPAAAGPERAEDSGVGRVTLVRPAARAMARQMSRAVGPAPVVQADSEQDRDQAVSARVLALPAADSEVGRAAVAMVGLVAEQAMARVGPAAAQAVAGQVDRAVDLEAAPPAGRQVDRVVDLGAAPRAGPRVDQAAVIGWMHWASLPAAESPPAWPKGLEADRAASVSARAHPAAPAV
jgi:hypothetical protein